MKQTSYNQLPQISESGQLTPDSEIFFVPPKNHLKPAPRIALVASIAWTLWNYRIALIKALENAGYEVILIAGADASTQELERHTTARFFPLKSMDRSNLSPFANLRMLAEMIAVFRKAKPDLLMLFTIRPNTFGNFAAALLHIPTISTIEGMGISGSGKSWLRIMMQTMYRMAFRSAKKVFFLNPDDQQDFIQKGIVSPAKAFLIPGPGVDMAHFSPAPRQPQQATRIFLFVSRLLIEKGVREFVAAARILKKEGISAEFRILGDMDAGNPTSITRAELDSWILENVIQYEGYLDDVRPVIAQTDVVVLPSYYKEGVPRAILEGMSMEKMVITTDSVGCRETVVDGENGYLTPVRDIPALAEAMKKAALLSDDEIREMGQNSRKMVAEKFSDSSVLPQYLAAIKSLLVK